MGIHSRAMIFFSSANSITITTPALARMPAEEMVISFAHFVCIFTQQMTSTAATASALMSCARSVPSAPAAMTP